MKQCKQRSPKKASAVWDLVEAGFDMVGQFAPDSFMGLLLFVVILVILFLIKNSRTIFQDW